MKTETKATHTPGPIVTLHKGGTKEQKIEIGSLQIPDLWHIGLAQESQSAKEAVILTWHMAHDLKQHIEETEPELLEALKAISALLTQPVQFTGIRNGASCDILRADCAIAVKRAIAAIHKAEKGEG